MTYHVTTKGGDVYQLASTNIQAALHEKEGLIGRRFLKVKTLGGAQDVFLHVDDIRTIQPTSGVATKHE
jgi:hypothetical protein